MQRSVHASLHEEGLQRGVAFADEEPQFGYLLHVFNKKTQQDEDRQQRPLPQSAAAKTFPPPRGPCP